MKQWFKFMAMALFLAGMILPLSAQPRAWHQGISKTNLDVRGNPVVVGELTMTAPEAGSVLVQFDGQCISDPGDRIVLAASNVPDWGVNDGNVGVEAANADANRNSFSHTRLYPVSAGNHTFYAVAENFVEQGGSGVASIYGSLTLKFFPDRAGEPLVRHLGISQTRLNVRNSDVVVGAQTIEATTAGYVRVRFDGLCIADVGDRIVLAASNTPNWGVNDGNTSVEAVDADVNSGSFSHSRVYQVGAGRHTFYAVARNYVETEGSGEASIYGSLTVEFFPDSPSGAMVKHQGISQTNINVRGGAVPLGQLNLAAPGPGKVVVQFDGFCVTDVGDRIVLAASNTPNWGVNDGNVGVEAVNADQNGRAFSHTRVYDVTGGSYNFYAVAQNYVEEAGNGIASIYASLTVEYFPEVIDAILTSNEIPQTFQLRQNYPNPFNPATQIEYNLPRASHVILDIYNAVGQRVTTLVNEHQQAGQWTVQWSAESFPTGIYYYRLYTESGTATRKMVYMR